MVNNECLGLLEKRCPNIQSFYAIFSLLAEFSQRNYNKNVKIIQQSTFILYLVVFGEEASSTSQEKRTKTPY